MVYTNDMVALIVLILSILEIDEKAKVAKEVPSDVERLNNYRKRGDGFRYERCDVDKFNLQQRFYSSIFIFSRYY
uniref:Uncharacterized protein n=1 Tax=Onchocerca volvulus TaxID=6282 RepID=A0A8R1TNY4_ONCVO